MTIRLFLDEDGTIWYDEAGESREVASLAAYDYDTGQMYTEAEAIAEAIAEATDAESGVYELYALESGKLLRTDTFSQ